MRRAFWVLTTVVVLMAACSSGTASPGDPEIARQEKLSALIAALPGQE